MKKDKPWIIFNIEKTTKKLATGTMLIPCAGDDPLSFAFPTRSGGYGKGYLPLGTYKVVSCIKRPDTKKYAPFKKDGFPWIAGILPQFETDRDNLGIHPDGNVPGSLGCPVIYNYDVFAFYMITRILADYRWCWFKVV